MSYTERYVRADAAGSGDGTTNTNSGANGAWTLAEAIAAYAAGQRLNVKAGTYANTTTSRTFATAGSTTSPVWWRGFKTTPGDMDDEPTSTRVAGTDIPSITFTTGLFSITGAHQIFSNLSISGANTGRQLNSAGASCKFDRVRVENTNAAAGSVAVLNSANGNTFTRCWFKATSTATRVFQNTAATILQGCGFEGGGVGIDSTVALTLLDSSFNNVGSHGFQAITSAAIHQLINNTFYSVGGDGIRFDVLPTTYCAVINNVLSECGGYGINNNSGANTNVVKRLGNLFHSNTSGNENGFGDSPSLYEKTDASSPFTNAAGGDLSLTTLSNARGTGAPGLFENQSYTSYADRGAVQHQASGGSPNYGIRTGGRL